MRHLLPRCGAVAALALTLTFLPVIGLGAPAIGWARDNCAIGWVWNNDSQRSELALSALDEPYGPDGPQWGVPATPGGMAKPR